jgi:hypothetical protein
MTQSVPIKALIVLLLVGCNIAFAVWGAEQPVAQRAPAAAEADRADTAAIDAVMEEMERNFKAGDEYTYQCEVMFTPILDVMGGKTQMLAVLKPYETGLKHSQVAYISWKAIKPYRLVPGTRHKYAIIRYESVVSFDGQRLRKQSYQLGIKGDRPTWQFVSGDHLNPETYAELFPDFPKGTELPEVQRIVEKPDPRAVKQGLAAYRVGETTFEQFKRDAGLVLKRETNSFFLQFDGMTNVPNSSKIPASGTYMEGSTSGWRIYRQFRNTTSSFGKTNEQFIFVVGDSEGAISALTFEQGMLSKIGPAK